MITKCYWKEAYLLFNCEYSTPINELSQLSMKWNFDVWPVFPDAKKNCLSWGKTEHDNASTQTEILT